MYPKLVNHEEIQAGDVVLDWGMYHEVMTPGIPIVRCDNLEEALQFLREFRASRAKETPHRELNA